MNQAAVKAFLNGAADELLFNTMYTIAEYQNFTQGRVRRLIRLTNSAMSVDRFVKQEANKSIASEARFERNMSQEIPIKEEVTPSSP